MQTPRDATQTREEHNKKRITPRMMEEESYTNVPLPSSPIPPLSPVVSSLVEESNSVPSPGAMVSRPSAIIRGSTSSNTGRNKRSSSVSVAETNMTVDTPLSATPAPPAAAAEVTVDPSVSIPTTSAPDMQQEEQQETAELKVTSDDSSNEIAETKSVFELDPIVVVGVDESQTISQHQHDDLDNFTTESIDSDAPNVASAASSCAAASSAAASAAGTSAPVSPVPAVIDNDDGLPPPHPILIPAYTPHTSSTPHSPNSPPYAVAARSPSTVGVTLSSMSPGTPPLHPHTLLRSSSLTSSISGGGDDNKSLSSPTSSTVPSPSSLLQSPKVSIFADAFAFLLAGPPNETEKERRLRLARQEGEDLAFLLGTSEGMFENKHVKRKTANVELLQQIHLVKRKVSVAEQAERMRLARKSANSPTLDAAATAAAGESSAVTPVESTPLSLVDTPLTDEEGAAQGLRKDADGNWHILTSDEEDEDGESRHRRTAVGDATQRIHSSDIDTSSPDSSDSETVKLRKREKHQRFLTKKYEKEQRLKEMFERSEQRSSKSSSKSRSKFGSPGQDWLKSMQALRSAAILASSQDHDLTEEERLQIEESIREAKRIAREEEEREAAEEAAAAAAAAAAEEEAALQAREEADHEDAKSSTSSSSSSPTKAKRKKLHRSSSLTGSDGGGGGGVGGRGGFQLSHSRNSSIDDNKDSSSSASSSSTPSANRRASGGLPSTSTNLKESNLPSSSSSSSSSSRSKRTLGRRQTGPLHSTIAGQLAIQDRFEAIDKRQSTKLTTTTTNINKRTNNNPIVRIPHAAMNTSDSSSDVRFISSPTHELKPKSILRSPSNSHLNSTTTSTERTISTPVQFAIHHVTNPSSSSSSDGSHSSNGVIELDHDGLPKVRVHIFTDADKKFQPHTERMAMQTIMATPTPTATATATSQAAADPTSSSASSATAPIPSTMIDEGDEGEEGEKEINTKDSNEQVKSSPSNEILDDDVVVEEDETLVVSSDSDDEKVDDDDDAESDSPLVDGELHLDSLPSDFSASLEDLNPLVYSEESTARTPQPQTSRPTSANRQRSNIQTNEHLPTAVKQIDTPNGVNEEEPFTQIDNTDSASLVQPAVILESEHPTESVEPVSESSEPSSSPLTSSPPPLHAPAGAGTGDVGSSIELSVGNISPSHTHMKGAGGGGVLRKSQLRSVPNSPQMIGLSASASTPALIDPATTNHGGDGVGSESFGLTTHPILVKSVSEKLLDKYVNYDDESSSSLPPNDATFLRNVKSVSSSLDGSTTNPTNIVDGASEGYLSPSRIRLALRQRPIKVGSMNYFKKTISNRKVQPKKHSNIFEREASSTERAANETSMMTTTPTKLGFGSSTHQRPSSSSSKVSSSDPLHHEPFTLRSSLTPAGKSARRIFGRSAGGGGGGGSRPESSSPKRKRSNSCSTSPRRERQPDGSLSPPWTYTTSRIHDGYQVATIRHSGSMDRLPTTLKPKSAKLTARLQQMSTGFDLTSSNTNSSSSSTTTNGSLLTARGSKIDLLDYELYELETTRRKIRSAMTSKGKDPTKTKVDEESIFHRLMELGGLKKTPTKRQQQQQQQDQQQQQQHLIESMNPHRLRTLFDVPKLETPSPFKERNLFEHSPTGSSSKRPSSSSISQSQSHATTARTPSSSTSTPDRKVLPVAIAGLSPSHSMSTLPQYDVFREFQPLHTQPTPRILGSSSSTGSLLGLAKLPKHLRASKNEDEQDRQFMKLALKRHAIQGGKVGTGGNTVAASSSNGTPGSVVEPIDGTRHTWLDRMNAEAALVAHEQAMARAAALEATLREAPIHHHGPNQHHHPARSSTPHQDEKSQHPHASPSITLKDVPLTEGNAYASPFPLVRQSMPASFERMISEERRQDTPSSDSSTTAMMTNEEKNVVDSNESISTTPTRRNPIPTSPGSTMTTTTTTTTPSKRHGKTFGGFDPIHHPTQVEEEDDSNVDEQNGLTSQVVAPVHDWATSILAAVSVPGESHHPETIWRQAQLRHGARMSPGGHGQVGGVAHPSSASPLEIPLPQLIARVRHIHPILRIGTPTRSEYAKKLQQSQQSPTVETLRKRR